MADEDVRARLALFEKLCREHRIACTKQRRAVLEIVLARDDHPSADDVHDAALLQIPGISRTTVYRTLDTLVRMGLITKACHPGRAVRYDRNLAPHHHLVCLACNVVIDVEGLELGAIPLPDVSGFGFVVADARVQLRGICRECGRSTGQDSEPAHR
jgi:Fur family peroxide stress response transcriptional regulator